MPVDSTHHEYEEYRPIWETIRDSVDGSRTIKHKSTKYLPKLYDQSTQGYDDYRLRALYFGAPARTLEAFQGMLTRKAPKIEVAKDATAKEFLVDSDLRNGSFLAHIQSILWELLNVARAGTLVDYSSDLSRTYITTYKAEDILNWDTARIGGKIVLSFVMLKEESYEWKAETGHPAPDGYTKPEYDQWRELRLKQEGNAISATVTVWRKKHLAKDGEDAFVKIEERILTRRGEPLQFLPFTFHGIGTDPICPDKPIALDLCEVAIAQYRNSADYENGLHIAGLPTPWAAGFTDDTKTTLVLGVANAWVSPDVNAKCGFLEFTGTGLGSLKEAIKEKSEMMAALGARILDAPTNAAEATETVKLRQTSESNVLTDLAASAEQTLSQALRIAIWWQGTEKEPNNLRDTIFVAINKDLLGSKMPPAQLTALLQAVQSNAMSFETFFWNMQQGNMYPDGHDMEKEKTAIEQNPPPPPLPVDPNAPPPEPPPGDKKPPAKKPAAAS